MTYDVMLTFDLKKDASDKYPDVKEKLEELGFKQNWHDFDCSFINNVSESADEKYKLPENVYLSKFSDTDYASKKELAIFLRDKLKEILNGKFVFLIDKAENEDINGCAF